MRTLTCIAALCAALFMSHSAFAESTAAKACATDIKAQCSDEMKSGGSALKACMEKHFTDLSENCQVAIIRTAAVRRACRADATKFCGDKPGKSATAQCMRSHAADLSNGCKEALAKTGGK